MESEHRTDSYLGDMGQFLFRLSEKVAARRWSFANRGEMEPRRWREEARRAMLENLAFAPEPPPLEPREFKTIRCEGYTQKWVDFRGAEDYRVTGVLLLPEEGEPPHPAVVALHDHGGLFYYGKEKLIDVDEELPRLEEHKEQAYGGRGWASELARRGYAVLVTDALGWGVRNIVCPDLRDPCAHRLAVDSEEDVGEVNRRAAMLSGYLDQHAFFSGLSWAGIIAWDDRRSVDYLVSREDIDGERIACAGLSGGGFRSTYLFGSDPRIRCAGITGWMTRLAHQLIHEEAKHLGLFTAPAVMKEMDHCDVALLGAPAPLFVQQCSRDSLYPLQAMRESCEYIERAYETFGARENFRYEFYPVEHSFGIEMQEDMFSWLEESLGE